GVPLSRAAETMTVSRSTRDSVSCMVSAARLNGTPNDEMATVSAQSFSVEQTKRYAAAVNDPARMALSFAGVAGGDDESNEIIIRGNSPRGLLWRMEGIEIPNPNHFSEEGASGGGISALSVNVLANSDFFTGAFPAEYGNAASGVFDLSLRKGNNEKREYAFQAGVLGLDLAAEGPIGAPGGASYLANYRYSTLSILSTLGVNITGDGDQTDFQDATFKIQVPTTKDGYLSLWGLGGKSGNSYQLEGDPEVSSFISNRGVLGLNYFHRLNEKSYLEGIVSYAISKNSDIFEFVTPEENYNFTDSYTNRALRGSLRYNRKINARHTVQFGAIAHQLGYDLLEEETDEGIRNIFIDQNGETYFLQAYAQWKFRIADNLTLTSGFHGSYFGLEGQNTLEPRLGLRWNYKPGRSLSFGAGLHSRLEALATYLAAVPNSTGGTSAANRDLPLQQAAHLVIGHDWRFHKNWRWRLEAYYQDLNKVAIASPNLTAPSALTASAINFSQGFVNDSLFANGTGRNYGIESTLERFFNNGWYTLITTSVFRSRYTPRDGIERPSRFAADFVQNLLAGKEWTVGKRGVNTLGVNLRVIYTGGRREAPILLEESRQAGRTIRDWENNFASVLPAYYRIDTGINYRKNNRKTAWRLSLDIQNTTNRNNAFEQFYSARQDRIVTSTQLGLIPVLNYRLEF
ncbi:MAG: TonB-dependent receptor, partial [Bacteroidota bacterium]